MARKQEPDVRAPYACAYCLLKAAGVLQRIGVERNAAGVWSGEHSVFFLTQSGYLACGCCSSELSLGLSCGGQPVVKTIEGKRGLKASVTLRHKHPTGRERMAALTGGTLHKLNWESASRELSISVGSGNRKVYAKSTR